MKWLAMISALFFVAACDATSDVASDHEPQVDNDFMVESEVVPPNDDNDALVNDFDATDDELLTDDDVPVCRIGDKRCVDYPTRGIVTCGEEGWGSFADCGYSTFCYTYWLNGKYQAACSSEAPSYPICDVGDVVCMGYPHFDNLMIKSCQTDSSPDGLFWNTEHQCEGYGAEICLESFTDGHYSATCVERVCTEGETDCCEGQTKICACDDKGEWSIVVEECSYICARDTDYEGKSSAWCDEPGPDG